MSHPQTQKRKLRHCGTDLHITWTNIFFTIEHQTHQMLKGATHLESESSNESKKRVGHGQRKAGEGNGTKLMVNGTKGNHWEENLQKSPSANAVHRVLHTCRLNLCYAKKKPYANIIQEHPHPLCAEAHKKLTETKCITALWSDESKCTAPFRYQGHCVLWIKKERDHPARYQL